ncbi:MAG TPA: gamma-glutamyl-gamma-aminobutyrate hydrolase family protein [Solirubrobacteraceae bacterium]|nr:gamma-glutamyl-gamma-aminobutyrate hydrolase family protein [Solirubrobacteraceae bacterium]
MSDSRPVIAVPTALEPARYGVWEAVCALLQMGYVRAVQQAGAMALMIPPDPELVEHPDEILDRVDGLMLAGGADLDPASYGAPAHPQTVDTAPARDETELALVRRALERDMPVLGICRGMQLINVALGGTLHQHLPDLVGHSDHRRNPGSFDGSEHDVRLEPGSLAARVIGEELHATKSHHHQGVDLIGEGLLVSGRSVLDDLPEALEAPDSTFVLGVQWHPEADPTSPVVGALVDEVRSRRLARR